MFGFKKNDGINLKHWFYLDIVIIGWIIMFIGLGMSLSYYFKNRTFSIDTHLEQQQEVNEAVSGTISFVNKLIWAIVVTPKNFNAFKHSSISKSNVYILSLHIFQYVLFVPFMVMFYDGPTTGFILEVVGMIILFIGSSWCLGYYYFKRYNIVKVKNK